MPSDNQIHIGTFEMISKLPLCWHGLFGAMRSHDMGSYDLDQADVWYQNEAKSQYGSTLSWEDLLVGLCTQEPICIGDNMSL